MRRQLAGGHLSKRKKVQLRAHFEAFEVSSCLGTPLPGITVWQILGRCQGSHFPGGHRA